MDLNVIRKPPILFGQATNYSLRIRPYEALKRGLTRGQFVSIPSSLERIRKNSGWARGTHESLFIFNKYFFNLA
jgi:hypothetical protein